MATHYGGRKGFTEAANWIGGLERSGELRIEFVAASRLSKIGWQNLSRT
jgi:hypothetical protein